MKIRLNENKLPSHSCGDIISDIVMETGKQVSCPDIQGSDGVLTIEIDNGTSQDLKNLKDAGFDVEEVKE